MHIVPSVFTTPFKRRATTPCQPGARQGTQVWATDSASLLILPPAPSADGFLPPEELKPNSLGGPRGPPLCLAFGRPLPEGAWLSSQGTTPGAHAARKDGALTKLGGGQAGSHSRDRTLAGDPVG